MADYSNFCNGMMNLWYGNSILGGITYILSIILIIAIIYWLINNANRKK